jgi:hypothetical protein
MVRRMGRASVLVDERLLRAVKALAARTGKSEDEVIDAALRRYLALGAAGAEDEGLDEDEALQLAYDELRAMRAGQ